MTINARKYLMCSVLVATLAPCAFAKIKVVTTIPDLAWAAREVGGSSVEVKSLLEGTENAHFVDAVPEFIRLVANADVVCKVGLQLEIGWLPKVLSKSGNAKVQRGGKGFCDLGAAIQPLEKPYGQVDRSMGHIHPAGNPHYWLAPSRLAAASAEMVKTFTRVDPRQGPNYRARYKLLQEKLRSLEASLKRKLHGALTKHKLSKSGANAIQYHSDFSYFLDAYGLRSHGSIEEKPGVKPSAGRIATVAALAKQEGVSIALALQTDPSGTLKKFSELSGIPVVRLPGNIRPSARSDWLKTYDALQKHYIDSLIVALSSKK